MKRLLSLLLVVTLVFGMAVTTYASEDEQNTEATENTETTENAEAADESEVKLSSDWSNWPEGPEVSCESAIVMEVKTGAVLYAKNIDDKHYPASITKVLTAILAMEYGKLDDPVKITEDCISFLKWDESQLGLKVGNEMTMKQALYATLLKSANEAAYAVAKNTGTNIGKDYDWFIDEMNNKVQELGGTNSHFVNANGLHDENHYTTAHDMALIGREVFNYPKIFKIMQKKKYRIKATDKISEYVFSQHHRMLKGGKYHYDYAIGGKTGRTMAAGSTLITMADNGEMQLVCVVLKGSGVSIYDDTKAMFEYAFDNFSVQDLSTVAAENGMDSGDGYDCLMTGEETSETYADDTKLLRDAAGYVVLPNTVSFDQLTSSKGGETSDGAPIVTYAYNGHKLGAAVGKKKSVVESIFKHDKKKADKAAEEEEKTEEGSGDESVEISEEIPEDFIGGVLSIAAKILDKLINR